MHLEWSGAPIGDNAEGNDMRMRASWWCSSVKMVVESRSPPSSLDVATKTLPWDLISISVTPQNLKF
jgi:hypothetical protein